jgi:hypothetical protein
LSTLQELGFEVGDAFLGEAEVGAGAFDARFDTGVRADLRLALVAAMLRSVADGVEFVGAGARLRVGDGGGGDRLGGDGHVGSPEAGGGGLDGQNDALGVAELGLGGGDG